MTASAVLQLYLAQALLLTLGALTFRWAWLGCERARASVPPARWLRYGLTLLAACLLLPLAARVLPRRGDGAMGWRPAATNARIGARSALPAASALALPSYRLRGPQVAPSLAPILLAALALGALGFGVRSWRARRRLRGALAGLPVLRRIGRVTLCVSDWAEVPYSARAGGRAWVVAPADWLERPSRLRVLLAHELQHHRQRDLQIAFALETLQALFFWLPAIHAWRRSIAETQELACDSAVLSRRRIEVRAYGTLLLDAASANSRWRFAPCAGPAATGHSAAALERRIRMLLNHAEGPQHSRLPMIAVLACLALIASAALVARAAVAEKRVTAADAAPLLQDLAQKGLSVQPSDVLLEELNTLLSTPKWQDHLTQALPRLASRQAELRRTFDRHHVPAALAAVAVVESGFRSLEPRPDIQGAGVWQFIPSTARTYGLRVGPGVDERLDFERETDAAARYLSAMYLQFQDWPLAVAAYSQGSSAVLKATGEAGTRDGWDLIRRGKLDRYAATVIAAAIVLENPGLLEQAGH